MASKSVLLVDISNTRTKFCLSKDGDISGDVRVLPTSQIADASVYSCTRGWAYESVLISSVVPHAAATLCRVFSNVPTRLVSMSNKLPVDFSEYAGKDTLGADRICNVLGTVAKGHFPSVAIDLGTAVTFDVVNKNEHFTPVFLGGTIAPGASLFKDYLSSRTALLPFVNMPFSTTLSVMGQNTLDSMQSGISYGFVGMVKEILCAISSFLGCTPYVIATGGDAAWLAARLSAIHEVDQLLTFRGMVLLQEFES